MKKLISFLLASGLLCGAALLATPLDFEARIAASNARVLLDTDGNLAAVAVVGSGDFEARTAFGNARVRTDTDGNLAVVLTNIVSSGATPTADDVGANSCGTTSPVVAGNETNGTVTVGETSGTQCRVTFATAATNRRECMVTNESNAQLARATYVSTTTTDFKGTFAAGDVLAYICATR